MASEAFHSSGSADIDRVRREVELSASNAGGAPSRPSPHAPPGSGVSPAGQLRAFCLWSAAAVATGTIDLT